jgi:tRNA(Ile)-lysidine synthase
VAFSPQRLRESLSAILGEACLAPASYCVALSGGLDSTVLLVALAAEAPQLGVGLRAVHVDHGLHPDAGTWSQRCLELAAGLGVPCDVAAVDARPRDGQSPEAVAREARYAALAQRLRPGEVLLTAHHADDQLETVLLQWLRGGGLAAVAGMRPLSKFASGWLLRPLLDWTRAELREWAVRERLEWLEDPSNEDPRFDRNYLRLAVLPALRARWPAAARTVGRVAGQAAGALAVEAEVAAAGLARLAEGETLALAGLQPLAVARQRLLLRAWLRSRGLEPPSLATLESMRRDMLSADGNRIPQTRWPGGVVRRYRGRLHAAPALAADASWHGGEWHPGERFDLGPLGWLELVATSGCGLSRDRLRGPLAVLPRPAGAVFRPAGSTHHRELRKWLQERGVLPWMRASLPCVQAGGEIVAIGDLAYGGDLAAAPGEPSWCISWHRRPVVCEAEAIGGGRSG